MKPPVDYHMHTPLCGHATGQPQEYAKRAVELGLKEIGFSDHAPFVHMVDPRVTMSREQLPQYLEMIQTVQRQFKDQLNIKIALETDFIPGFESKTQDVIDFFDYDYIIGSVHFIKDWGFDDPSQRQTWEEKDINQVYVDYFDLLRQSAKSGMFDIMGHVDLVKKFGHRSTEDMTSEVEQTAEVFKQSGVAVEINTAGLRKPIGEMYPALDHLKIYARHGIPLTFGSDAHQPLDVGKDFNKALEWAKEAGFKEHVLFSKRKISSVLPL